MCLAVPGRLTEIRNAGALTATGLVDFGGVVREASLACLPEARVGDWVLVHAGIAIAIVDASRRAAVLEALDAGDRREPS
jgi:hydrogenase expression/formation protein HypC